MDRPVLERLCNILVLAFFICGLAVPFVAESLNQADSPAIFELAGNGGIFQDAFEHSEDDLFLSFPKSMSGEIMLFATIMISGIYFFLPTILPHLPPPKNSTIA
jgi:hypothetical protein